MQGGEGEGGGGGGVFVTNCVAGDGDGDGVGVSNRLYCCWLNYKTPLSNNIQAFIGPDAFVKTWLAPLVKSEKVTVKTADPFFTEPLTKLLFTRHPKGKLWMAAAVHRVALKHIKNGFPMLQDGCVTNGGVVRPVVEAGGKKKMPKMNTTDIGKLLYNDEPILLEDIECSHGHLFRSMSDITIWVYFFVAPKFEFFEFPSYEMFEWDFLGFFQEKSTLFVGKWVCLGGRGGEI
jgi:hypothetical protein